MKRYLIGGSAGIALTVAVLWGAGLLGSGSGEVTDTGDPSGVGSEGGAPGSGSGAAGGGGRGSGRRGAGADEEAPLFDGPYVFWSGDSLAYVGSICGDSAVFETFEAEADGTLRFTDPCAPERSYEINSPREPDPAVFEGGGRIFAVSDVEGNPEELRLLLRNAGVVDEEDRWAWGDGRLVFVGDMVDRGDQVTDGLWWVYQLERQAQQAGGRVHIVLGNHDTMIMYNDIRYAADKYKLVAPKFRSSLSGLYGPSTEFGRWLRSKPTLLRIGDVLFVHGGISDTLVQSGLDLEGVNEAIRLGLDEPWRTRAPGTHQMLFGSDGPLWYRGYFRDEGPNPDEMAAALATYGAQTVVVGHTIVENIQRLHDGLVYGIDVTFTDAARIQGLLIEDGRFYRVDAEGKVTLL